MIRFRRNLSVFVFFTWCQSIHADLVLDQAFEGATFGRSGQLSAQTFTVEEEGVLDRIEVRVGSLSGEIDYQLRTTSLIPSQRNFPIPSAPNSTDGIISSGSLPVSTVVEDWHSIDLAADSIDVGPGDVLGLVLDLNGAIWGGGSTPPLTEGYEGGYALYPEFGKWQLFFVPPTNDPADFNFRTFVNTPNAIPEASSLACLGVLCGWIIFCQLRTRTAGRMPQEDTKVTPRR